MIHVILIAIFSFDVCVSEFLFRPCDLSDAQCMRRHLAAYSSCDPNVVGQLPHDYTIDPELSYELPYFNMTVIEKRFHVRNQQLCFVTEFFFTDKYDLVISIDCPSLKFESDTTLLIHESGKGDEDYHYHLNFLHPLVQMTSTLKLARQTDLCSSFVFTESPSETKYTLVPKDKESASLLSRLELSAVEIYKREKFLVVGEVLFRRFVNDYLCDFGCD